PFALAILDIAHGIGLLAVDRMGIRTLCYANPHGKMVFGPTTDSVLAHPEVTRELSDQGIFNYLYCHTVPSPGTVYKAVQKLLPGECVIFRNGRIERKSYWRLEYADETAPGTALEERFHSLLRESVARAVNGDRAGAFLSGGTDSSTVTGILSEIRGRPVDTYSIGFAADGFDEMDYARITARHFGARAHEYYVTPQDVVDAIPLIAQHYDEPFGNDSAVPTYYCARLAREDGIEVMLAGDGGDEIFGGNVRYAKQKIFEYYGLIPQAVRRGLIEPLVFSMPAADKLPPLRKVKSYIRQANVPLPDRLETYNFLHRQPLAEIFEADFLARVDAQGPLRQMREVYRSTLSDSAINRMLHLDLKQTLADNDLRKVSRMCDAAGVEVRYPLIDEALVEFSGQLPASLKVKGLKLRYFFKQALRDFLPPQTIAKSKHGFGVPFGVWMKEYKPLRELTLSSLEALQHRGYIKPSYVRQVLHAHQTGHATYFGKMIWVMTMLERWLAARDL
ncbi:MAG TPA: asparagine synthase C-terminal domain-containing protein, partial [Candidatus Obscuribacterales bacterium]